MKIKDLTLSNNLILAPMAGVTDRAFREITKPFGPALMYTEMVSGKGLFYKSRKTAELLEAQPCEKPVAVQIFGHEPEILAEIASKALSGGADMIDINMGCPAPKIVNNGDGCALMKSPKLAGELVSAVRKAVNVPLTVKFRAGYTNDNINAVEFAKIIEANGADAITVHGRTREQFYSGKSDIEIIKKVKEAVKIPVIGNGDITDGKSAEKMLSYTGCDFLMIGRGAQGDPWIFKEISEYLGKGVSPPPPSVNEILSVASSHLDLLVKYKGEHRGVLEGRKHMSWYFKGLKGGSILRTEINRAETKEEMESLLNTFCKKYITEAD